MNQSSTILVTGASGFVGRHVAYRLAERGHRVIALCHKSQLPQHVLAVCKEVISGDISDYDSCKHMLQGVDGVCHLAGFIPERYGDPLWAQKCYQVNALASLNLAMCAVEMKVPRFIYISGANMYCPSKTPSMESCPIYPDQVAPYYLTSKLAGELYVNNICQNQQTDALILRIATPYGPAEPVQKVIPSFMKQASQAQPLRVFYGGLTTYNFVYVDDVAELITKAVMEGPAGIYNISSAEHTSLAELAQTVAKVYSDKKIEIKIDPPSNDAFAGFSPISIEKACKTWNYNPSSLLEGIKKYRQFLENQSAEL